MENYLSKMGRYSCKYVDYLALLRNNKYVCANTQVFRNLEYGSYVFEYEVGVFRLLFFCSIRTKSRLGSESKLIIASCRLHLLL